MAQQPRPTDDDDDDEIPLGQLLLGKRRRPDHQFSYEEQRLKRIQVNKEFLKTLDVNRDIQGILSTKPQAPRRRRTSAAPSQPSRSSQRIKKLPVPTYIPSDPVEDSQEAQRQ